MSFGLLGFPRRPQPDPVTAATQQWLDKEGRAEQSARAALLELQVRYGDLDSTLRERNRAYGRASATIGELRGTVARLRERLTEWEVAADDDALIESMRRHPSGAVDPADTAKVGDDMPGGWLDLSAPGCGAKGPGVGFICTRPRVHPGRQHVATAGLHVVEVWPNDADAALVATAERLGDEVGQRDRQAAIEGAAVTLAAHMVTAWTKTNGDSRTTCRCGWASGLVPGQTPAEVHARHVAEQLAVTGALGAFAQPGPRPTPRTGSFADGGKRTFADGNA